MKTVSSFNEHEVLHNLKHYLPAQAPLKDFIHHNTLHAFQNQNFFDGITHASKIFGYNVSLSIAEYRRLYATGKINPDVVARVINERIGSAGQEIWQHNMLNKEYEMPGQPRIGLLRANWKEHFHIDLDSLVHPTLFRVICSYLDQGISIWNFPAGNSGFLVALRNLERNSFTSFFKTKRARNFLLKDETGIESLLDILIGNSALYEHYLYDQQFAHPGWSGMVAAVEDQPQTLLDPKQISLHDFIVFELLLEIDALDARFGPIWSPLGNKVTRTPINLFAPVKHAEVNEVLTLWQLAYEWSYYDQVLSGLHSNEDKSEAVTEKSFQAMFCIDDRECSLRRYVEEFAPHSETFGTPGFFGVEFFFKPENGKFYTKLCPAPVTPKYLVKEIGGNTKHAKDVHFTKHTHSLVRGWFFAQSLGFWSAFKLIANIFRPTMSPATASSFKHMDSNAQLTIENTGHNHTEDGLQVGYTIDEMAIRVENLLKSIGLINNFAPLVYVMGHGSSSVNNPHYAAYDCGACAGRAGSVNSRVLCYMANHARVREVLTARGLEIPYTTRFVGGLHDTTRDEMLFFDIDTLPEKYKKLHANNVLVFNLALDANAKERSRRFESINTKMSAPKIHKAIRTRSVSLFEPRPELNHATNTLCIIGRRNLTKGVFLDRRSFMNSFDYTVDPDGKYLFNILKAAAPVCGGINLEYYFSRVDNQKLGAGTKLPHNVMGLIGVANGIDGDLRTGLPSQMIEVHDPMRLLMVVEHFPNVVLNTIKRDTATYEWFINEWVHLVVINPETKQYSVFKNGEFFPYYTLQPGVSMVKNLTPILEQHTDNLPVYQIAS